MEAKVSIIMGSFSDWKIVEKAANRLDDFEIPFEIKVFSAHRTPECVEEFSKNAKDRGIKVIIAAAGKAAHLAGVIAAYTTLPIIAIPIDSSLSGIDALLAMVQMPSGIPVATVAINGAENAAILAAQILSISDSLIDKKLSDFKDSLKNKVIKDNNQLKEIKYKFKID